MSEFQASNFKKENGGTPDLLGKTELTSPYFFVPPSGTTADRPQDCAAGTLRFNTDIGTLEVFIGDTLGWQQIVKRENQYLGGGTGSNAGTGTRATFAGGYTSDGSPYPTTDTIEFLTISTLGNSQDFGNLVTSGVMFASVSDTTRCLFAGNNGRNINQDNTIDFITFATTGNASDFGDLSETRGGPGDSGCGSSTRGLIGGGYTSSPTVFKDTIDYVTIAQTGNAVDFGNLTQARAAAASCSSTTRGIWMGGYHPTTVNIMDFVEIATLGNAVDFGDVGLDNDKIMRVSGASNSTRGLCIGGLHPTIVNSIEFITIATRGNSTDFGDLTETKYHTAATADPTRAVVFCGTSDAPIRNTIEFVTIATTGNATDFGDATAAKFQAGGSSNGHGGL